jgi:nucleoside-diphosphate-sugar epimerase
MNVLVTGATGFIGRHLTQALLRRGDQVSALVRPTTCLTRLVPGTTAISYAADTDLAGVVSEAAPEIVFHLATRFQERHGPDEIAALIEANITYGARIVEAVSTAGVPCFINTATWWQHHHDAPYSPTSFYAATKQGFEDILRYYSDTGRLRVINLTLFDTYGPDDTRDKIVSRFATMTRDQSSLDMSPGEQLLDLVHVEDVAQAYIVAANRLQRERSAAWEDFVVSSRERISLRNLARFFAECSGVPLNIHWGAKPYRDREIMIPWTGGTHLPGWHPEIGLRDGICRLLGCHV